MVHVQPHVTHTRHSWHQCKQCVADTDAKGNLSFIAKLIQGKASLLEQLYKHDRTQHAADRAQRAADTAHCAAGRAQRAADRAQCAADRAQTFKNLM